MFFDILSEMRIRQWTKNLFVYAAVLFHGSLFNVEALQITTLAFLSFGFTASGIYFFNDINDIERDKLNPKKCTRPIASGKIGKPAGYFCSACLMIVGALAAQIPMTIWFILYVMFLSLLLALGKGRYDASMTQVISPPPPIHLLNLSTN